MQVRTPALVAACLAAAGMLVLVGAPSGQADTNASLQSANTVPASGRFILTTANGVAPTLQSSDIQVFGLAPASAFTDQPLTKVQIIMPAVAQNGSANFLGGGLQFSNSDNHRSVTCAAPVVDIQAHVLDCVIRNQRNLALLTITTIDAIDRSGGSTSQLVTGMQFKIAGQDAADYLNAQLGVNIFSPSVLFATGTLSITTSR